MRNAQMNVPCLVRIKPGALQRLGLYLARSCLAPVALLHSQGLLQSILDVARQSLRDHGIAAALVIEVKEASVEEAVHLLGAVPSSCRVLIGVGGGKALDVAKYTASLAALPYFAVPTSLSNDGFCSPQASLTIRGKRRSFPAALPFGVVGDTAVCLEAPRILTLSGIGDLVAKFTAIQDWKLAFHRTGELIDDFAALLSTGSIRAYLSHPHFDLKGMRLLATALLLNGIAMEICGSSRPASGSEHLISHALDALSARPRLHGLQVGIAAYLESILQGGNTDRITGLFDVTGFWDAVAEDRFSRSEWLQAIRAAPSVKEGYYTVLSSRDVLPEAEQILAHDPHLRRCFQD